MPKQIPHSFLRWIGDTLKQARASKGWAQRDLSERVGLPQSHISKIEQGGVDLQLSSLVEMARALDLELKLVPRHALSAVEGLIKTAAPDEAEQSTRRARATLAGQEQLAREVATHYPTLTAAADYSEALKALQGVRFDPNSLKILQKALGPAQKIAAHLATGSDTRHLAAALDRVNANLRHLRAMQNHAAPLAPARQIPAHSLSEEEDDD